MIPFQPLLIPLFLVLKTIGLSSSLLGVGLIYVAFQMPFAVFVMRNAFLDVPRALEDAGRVDGANGLKLFTNVLFPLVRPGIITVGMFAFFSSWNEYMAAMVLLQSQDSFPLPVVLQTAIVTGLTGVDWSLLQAGVLATMLPCLLLFFVLQRFYISGIVAGAVKD
jgi:multiple sugar transport system permease protein